MSALEVMPASLADADRLAAIHRTGFDEPWSAESLAELMIMPGAVTLMVLSAENLIGFVLARTGGGEAEIITICVTPEGRGRGVGQVLVSQAMASAAALGAEAMFLEVADDNLPAISLYRRCGFVEVGRRPGYYARGKSRVDALIWRRDLTAKVQSD